MPTRLEKFLACKHTSIQAFTECCMQCGENIYTTAEQIIKEEEEEEEEKEKNKPVVVDGVLSFPIWHKTGGGGMVNREFLDSDHPEQTYNYLRRHGLKPEDYGIRHPLIEQMTKEFEGKNRDELIIEIIALRKELTELNRMMA